MRSGRKIPDVQEAVIKGVLMKDSTQEVIERYQKHLFAIAFNICKNQQDAEDVVQDTFIGYHTYKKEFDTEEHIRAWLIRVAINKAKNITRSFWRRNKCNLEEYMETLTFETPESGEPVRDSDEVTGKIPDCPALILL